MILAMNANFLRTAHYPPDHRLLDLCEEMGLFVMCEVPFGFGDKWLDDSGYTPELLARASATVRRDVHYGCIISWSIGNENHITPSTLETAERVKALDPAWPVCFPMRGNDFYEKAMTSARSPA
jgi:beta-galactosidase